MPRTRDDDLNREIDAHLELEAEERVAGGLSPDQARRAAHRAFGNVLRVREDARCVWTPPWHFHRSKAALLRDARYGLRSIRRTAPLSLAVVLTLVLGVSMNSVVFSVFNGLVFRPAVTREPASFIQMYVGLSGSWQRELHGPRWLATLEDLETVRRATRTLSAVAAARWASFSLAESGASLRGVFVSCNYLATHLGPMRAGRGLVDDDCAAPGGDSVVVLTERGWQRHFGSDPSILGRTVRVNNHPLTIVGIAPDDAVGPVAAMLYVPYTLQPLLQGPLDYFREPAGRHAWLTLSGRLQPGRNLTEAQLEIDVLTGDLDRRHPETKTRILVTNGAIIHEPETARSMPILMALCVGTTGVILLLVCGNVTTLLLARAVARRQEMAVRLALGASRGQLFRQLLIETSMLGGGAGIVSLVAAWYLPNHVAQMLTDFPLQQTFGPDGRVIALTLGVALLAGGIAGLSPAIETLRVGITAPLRSGGRGGSRYVPPGLSGLLIGNQLSISLALLVVVAMIGRAQLRLLDVRLDYDPATVIITTIDLPRTGYPGRWAQTFYDRLVPELAALPGVRAVSLSSPAPFRGVHRRAVRPAEDGAETRLASWRAVSPGFFPMTGVRLVEGRLFTEIESRVPGEVTPVMVSSSFARRHYPGASSVGRRIRLGDSEKAEIVGVVSDTVSVRASDADEPIVYQPLYSPPIGSVTPLVQTSANTPGLAEMIRARVRALDARLTPRPETVAATLAGEASQYAALIRVTAIPASLALCLSLVGIYGLAAFAAAQRTHEISVRVACGARPREVVHLLVRWLRRPFLAGVLGGTLLSLGSVWMLGRTALRLNLPPADPLALAVATGVLLAAALTAAAIPALRAARKDPWAALKQ